KDIILHVKTLSETLADISKLISSNTGITAEKFNATYAMIDTASSTLSDITSKLSDTRNEVQDMSQVLTKISKKADHSTIVLGEAVDSIEKIESSANQVSNIVEVVDEIAFKTNLLSLNAAIEAARAGESGKGFAVVAESVRELSMQTANAVEMIKKLIDDTNLKVVSGRSSVNNIVSFINELVGEFRSISNQISQIKGIIENHVNEVGSVDRSLSDIRRITQESTEMVDNVYQVSRKLNVETANLRKEVTKIQDIDN
ncbi:MAG TPA: methyl-accepting chemotaxis protein, partial [bacterium]|nr:methyl-accepting chemotaxis protein [bacterium]